MGEVVPPDAGISTEVNDQDGRNSPASAVCYQNEITPDFEEGEDGTGTTITPQATLEPPVEEHAPHLHPPSLMESFAAHIHDGSGDGHFSPMSGHDIPPPHVTTSSATGSFVEPSSSTDASISHLDLTTIASAPSMSSSHFGHHLERPIPRHTVSSASTASQATIKPSDFVPQFIPEGTVPEGIESNQLIGTPSSETDSFPEIVNRRRHHPKFPDQSYAALHSQQHPPPYPPHTLRTRSSNPSPYHSYVAAAKGQKEYSAATPSGSRTAGNSPSGSPGLFTPTGSPNRPRSVHDEASGTYSSPFLHYTQRQIPKETHVADIDVDPVSGRKIINQYEIIDELGRGVHGKVKLGRNLPDNTYVAIKIVERYSKKKRLGKSNSHEDKIKKEIAILKKARHPNIVSLLEVIDDPQRKKVYIVLEFVELGEVAWRTPGNDAISLIEYRRHLRDSNDIKENDETAREEDLILEEARQKREKTRRRQLKQELAGRMTSPSNEAWSFEHYGEESDVEDPNADGASVKSSVTSGSYRSVLNANGDVEAISPPPPQLVPIASEDVQSTDFATITGLSDKADFMTHQPESFPSIDEFDTITATGLEGTMYGPYEDIARGRTPSVIGSSGSFVLEDPHHTHVPDHFKYVPLMTLGDARGCFKDTVLGLEYLHFQGVIHRDIKPANLLQTSDRRIKISDFGVSYLGRERGTITDPNESESEVPDVDESVELAKTVGTPAFYAPELCQTDSDEPTPPVTQQIDVWALGVTLYCLIFGRVPFHDHNPFALMAKIAEDPVHIPRQRLMAVEKQAASRPSSRSRTFQNRDNEHRDAYDVKYEPVDDDLYDLLRRLFIKDPRKRISLMEVKHHPWVLSGVSNPYAWLEDTDPTRDSTTRIQVSQKDVADAVVQLNFVERMSSTLRRVGNALGLGRSSSTRARAKSSVADPQASNLSSAASSSSTISQDGRRASVKPEESIFSALRAARELDHPLSQSQTASPAVRERGQYFPTMPGPPSHSDHSDNESDQRSEVGRVSRPRIAERANSTNSGPASTASTKKTLRQKDITKNLGLGNMTFPALPSTPRALDSPSGGGLGGIFGGAGHKIIGRFARSRDRREKDGEGRDPSTDRMSTDHMTDTSDDPHAEPSVAFSNTVASGLLRQPELPQSQPSSAAVSPISSRAGSIHASDILPPAQRGLSRHSSISSVSSARRRPPTASKDSGESQIYHGQSVDNAGEFDRAREESFRRRLVEEQQLQDRPPSSSQNRPLSGLSQSACPPSPDDEIFYRKQQEEAAGRPRSATYDQSMPPSSAFAIPSAASRLVTSSSSEDHYFSGLSQSTSNPSIPSVVSADSSLMPDPDDGLVLDLGIERKEPSTDSPSDDSTVYNRPSSQQRQPEVHHEEDEGYAGDTAVDSGDDDSDSEDDFLQMGRRKGRDRQQSRSESINVGELGRQRIRTAMGSAKGGRSESNGTMKKVRSRSLSGEEGTLKPAQSD